VAVNTIGRRDYSLVTIKSILGDKKMNSKEYSFCRKATEVTSATNLKVMKPNELFDLIKDTEYITSGDSVDWSVQIFDDEKRIRLIFQESNGKRDWQNNFCFPVKPYKQQENTLWLHKGWADAWKSCNDEVCEKAIRYMDAYPEYDMEVCGWSYGGAMAVIALEDLGFRTNRCDFILTTFGAPKALFGKKTREYVMSYAKEINQYTDVNDIVTLLPPFPFYKHCHKVPVDKKVAFGLLKPTVYHCGYGDKNLY